MQSEANYISMDSEFENIFPFFPFAFKGKVSFIELQ